MRTSTEIEDRINHIEQRLEIIKTAVAKELQLPFFDRRPKVCTFLDIERKIYTALLNEIKWLLNE
jgi:hypothetical protein